MAAPSQERSGVGLSEHEKIVLVAQALDVFRWSEAPPGVPVDIFVVNTEEDAAPLGLAA